MSEHALAALFKNKKSRARADEHMLPINDSLDIWEALSSILSSTIVYLKLCIETHEGGKKKHHILQSRSSSFANIDH